MTENVPGKTNKVKMKLFNNKAYCRPWFSFVQIIGLPTWKQGLVALIVKELLNSVQVESFEKALFQKSPFRFSFKILLVLP